MLRTAKIPKAITRWPRVFSGVYTRSTIGSGQKMMSGLIAVAIILGAIAFPATALGHEIDVNQARQKMERYALTVVQNSRYDDNPNIDCKKMFPHQVRCRVTYNRSAFKQTCSEDITVYFVAHMGLEEIGRITRLI